VVCGRLFPGNTCFFYYSTYKKPNHQLIITSIKNCLSQGKSVKIEQVRATARELTSQGKMGNRPDCAYFLLLGLCGAAFLLTIGGILTYIAFNPGSIDTHPHSALSHIPHFHHHTKHHSVSNNNNMNNNHENPQHHHYYPHGQQQSQQQKDHHQINPTPPTTSTSTNNATLSNSSSSDKTTGTIPRESHVGKQHELNEQQQHHQNMNNEKPLGETSKKNRSDDTQGEHHHGQVQHQHHSVAESSGGSSSHKLSSSTSAAAAQAAYEAKAKQSLALAIIGPLCLLMGIIVTLIVGILALKYDCDHEPEPNIAFLRLRSEMSLNFDPDKNNYELLRPSSSIDQAGGQYSINPTGVLRC
jgi:hypothetical protein